MAQLTAIVDKLLSNASSMYVPEGYISESILPLSVVKQKTGKLAKYGTNHLRIETTIGGGRGAYRRVESITRSTSSYTVDSHGLEDLVTQDDYDNVEVPYDAEQDVVMGLSSLLWLKKEKGLADTLTSTSVITQNVTLAGTEQYSDGLNSDPLDDFQTARSTVRAGCGVAPYGVAMDWAVWNVLRYHPQMMDAVGYKYARPGGLSVDELATAMGVKKLLVAGSLYESAAEGQTSSLAPVWGKHIVFFAAPDAAAKYQVSLGYRVQLSRSQPRQVFKYAINNPPGSTGVLVEDHWDMFISNASCAYLLKSVIA